MLCYFLRQYKPVHSVRLLKADGHIKANVFLGAVLVYCWLAPTVLFDIYLFLSLQS